MKKFKDFLNEQLQDAEVKKEYERLDPAFSIARDLIRLRKARGLSQKELAEKISSTQTVVSRIENGSVNSSINTIQKISEALGAHLTIQMLPQEQYDLFQEAEMEPTVEAKSTNIEFDRRSQCSNFYSYIPDKVVWKVGKAVGEEPTQNYFELSVQKSAKKRSKVIA